MSASALYALAWLAACASAGLLSGAICYRVGRESVREEARDAAAAFDEGRDDGLEAGRSEGEAAGYQRGHADGRRVGRAEVLTRIQATADLLAHPKGAYEP